MQQVNQDGGGGFVIELPAALKERNGFVVEKDGGLIRINVTLAGLSPLLMNAMSQEQLLAIRDKTKRPKNAAKPSLREEAESKLHLTADGKPKMPTTALFKSWINAGAFVRLDGKRQVSSAKSTVLPGMLSLEDHELPIYLPGTEEPATWEVDIQQGRNPNGGEACCIVRPRFDAWEIRCTIEVDQMQMPLTMARELIEIAGRRIGLLDGRPQCKCTFGRYGITNWKACG